MCICFIRQALFFVPRQDNSFVLSTFLYSITMSKSTVAETIAEMKRHNETAIADASEVNKTAKRKAALQTLAKKKTTSTGGKRKLPAVRHAVPASDDDDDDEPYDVDETQGTHSYIPREILLANTNRERYGKTGICRSSPASLVTSYEKGVSFCACYTVNLWQMRTQAKGVDRFTMTLRDLSRRYCKKKLKDLDPSDICIYPPSDTEEADIPEETVTPVNTPQKSKKQTKKQFAVDEAVEGESDDEPPSPPPVKKPKKKPTAVAVVSDDGDAYETTRENLPQFKEAMAKKKKAVTTAVAVGSTASVEIEEVTTKTPPIKHGIQSRLCPLCGNWMGVSLDKETGETKLFCITCGLPWFTCDNMHIVLTTLDLNLHPSFTYKTKGLPPLCEEHQYPARLYIFDFKEYKDKNGNVKPVSEERQMLKGRIFFVCGAPEEITKAIDPKGARCNFVLSAEFKGKTARYFEKLYTEEVLAVREAKQEGVRNYLYREQMERSRQQALRKARLAKWASLGLSVDDEDD